MLDLLPSIKLTMSRFVAIDRINCDRKASVLGLTHRERRSRKIDWWRWTRPVDRGVAKTL